MDIHTLPKTHLKKCIEYHTPTDLPINKAKKKKIKIKIKKKKKKHEYTYYQNFAEIEKRKNEDTIVSHSACLARLAK